MCEAEAPHPTSTLRPYLEEASEARCGLPKVSVLHNVGLEPSAHLAHRVALPKALVSQNHRAVVPAVADHAAHGLVYCAHGLMGGRRGRREGLMAWFTARMARGEAGGRRR